MAPRSGHLNATAPVGLDRQQAADGRSRYHRPRLRQYLLASRPSDGGLDAQIACFDDKRAWGFWRPITAVRLADTDGNPSTTADPTRTPLLITPPFPDHPSGHACGTAARMTTMRTFLGRDRVAFSAYSAASGTTRSFTSFSQAVEELLGARVWGGIHFRTADVQGGKLGEAVSFYVTARYFKRNRS